MASKFSTANSLSYTDEDQDAVEKIVAEGTFALADWRNLGKASSAKRRTGLLEYGFAVCFLEKKVESCR